MHKIHVFGRHLSLEHDVTFRFDTDLIRGFSISHWMVKCHDEVTVTVAFPDMYEYTEFDDIGWYPSTTDSDDDDPLVHVSIVERVPVQAHIFKYMILHDDLTDFMHFEDIVHLSVSSRLALAPAVSQTLAHIKWMVECHDDAMLESGITTMANLEATYESDLVPEDWICRSCGYHRAVAWLCYDECADCFYEH